MNNLKLTKSFSLGLAFLLYSFNAAACTAAPGTVWPSPSQAFEKAQHVVFGVVASMDYSSGLNVNVKLKNVRVLKGNSPRNGIVLTPPNAMCGVAFAVGQQYVVFIPKGPDSSVDMFNQPKGSSAEVLNELRLNGLTLPQKDSQ